MLAEWSVECAPEDPVLVVPWSADDTETQPELLHPQPSGTASTSRFIDLRENPYDLDHLPEAELYPPLMHALRALNAARSLVFTAKCDAWTLDSDELEHLRLNLDLLSEDTPQGFASYIDILFRERSFFASFHQNEQYLHRLTRRAESLNHPYAQLDCIIRPALVDLTGPHEGFAITLYIKALGPDTASASQYWSAALEAVVSLVRSKEMA
jgi:hypothetical protein